jgi:cytochrome c peroxidase
MHDGRLGTNLNDVTREMLTEDYIMNMDMRMMQERVKQDSEYLALYKAAGMNEPSNGNIRKLLPEYMKTLTTRNAPVDSGTMSAAAQRGEAIFDGKGNCNSCHTGALYSDGKRHNTGVPENLDVFMDPMNHQAYLAYGIGMGVENIFNTKRDIGAAVQSHEADGSDIGTFMTPQLRGLKYSAPYMHNGMMATLADVVDFYNQGGGADSHKSAMLKPLRLTDGEKGDLVAYLEALSGDALTGSEFVWSKPYPAEYEVIPNWTQVDNRTRAPIKK